MNEDGKLKVSKERKVVKLTSNNNDSDLKLKQLRAKFDKEYQKVKDMNKEDLQTLRHEMEDTEFDNLGGRNMAKGLLMMIDDHDTKLFTLEMMMKKGLLKVSL